MKKKLKLSCNTNKPDKENLYIATVRFENHKSAYKFMMKN